MQNKSKIGILAVVVCIIVVSGSVMVNRSSQNESLSGIHPGTENVTVYKSPSCGCCVNYIAYLKREGYGVEVVEKENMSPIKEKFGIPRNMESCHTTVMGDYFVEGHVPLEAVSMLFDQQPDIDGIALPAMPAGSPGMPGFKTGLFEIYGLKAGQAEVFTKI